MIYDIIISKAEAFYNWIPTPLGSSGALVHPRLTRSLKDGNAKEGEEEGRKKNNKDGL